MEQGPKATLCILAYQKKYTFITKDLLLDRVVPEIVRIKVGIIKHGWVNGQVELVALLQYMSVFLNP